MPSTLSSFNTTTEVPLSKAPRALQHIWLLQVCVHGVCVFTAVCVHFGWVKHRAQYPSIGHHTWLYVTSLSLKGKAWIIYCKISLRPFFTDSSTENAGLFSCADHNCPTRRRASVSSLLYSKPSACQSSPAHVLHYGSPTLSRKKLTPQTDAHGSLKVEN